MSNMRMIKVLKMIIVMAMMMPSKALGLQSIMLQKVIACGLSAIALGTTSTVVPQVEGLSLIRNGMPDIRYLGAQISQSAGKKRKNNSFMASKSEFNLKSCTCVLVPKCERLTWSRWQRQFYNLSCNFTISQFFTIFTNLPAPQKLHLCLVSASPGPGGKNNGPQKQSLVLFQYILTL